LGTTTTVRRTMMAAMDLRAAREHGCSAPWHGARGVACALLTLFAAFSISVAPAGADSGTFTPGASRPASAESGASEAPTPLSALGSWREWLSSDWPETVAEEQAPPISPTPPTEESAPTPGGSESTSPVATQTAAPSLSVSGQTVRWSPVGSETSYEVAVSSAPRGAASRTTTYSNQARLPGTAQSYTPSLSPGEKVYVGVSADGGVTWSESEVSVSLPSAPTPSVAGKTVRWKPIGEEASYEVAISTDARGSSDRTTEYTVVTRVAGELQSYTPTLTPGQTVFIGVSADGGLKWSAQEVSISAPPPVASGPAAPVLRVSGDTLSWTALAGVTSYRLATILNPTGARETTYTTVTGTSYTPPVQSGQTVAYGLAAAEPEMGPWAKEVTIVYPPSKTGGGTSGSGTSGSGATGEEAPGSTSETPASPPAFPDKIIGANDAGVWGTAAAQTVMGGHITWDRLEVRAGSDAIPTSLAGGFHVLAIVGNVGNETPLAQIEPAHWAAEVVSQIREHPGISIAEAGNEMYWKGNLAEPVKYGRMYLAAVNAMHSAGIHIPLLFNTTGDYPHGTWSAPSSWSQDARSGGWLRDAVQGVPGLAAAILANGISSHPYGALGENQADSGGVNAVAAQEAVAHTVLGTTPSFYITEFGYDLSRCGSTYGACSLQEQASKMKAAYQVFLADPHVAGIWWYETHDDGTGHFGFIENSGATRPAFGVLSSFALAEGQ
jgi:hypothetical protein